MHWIYEHLWPVVEVFFFFVMFASMIWLLYHFIIWLLKLFKYKSRKILSDEIEQLQKENRQLWEENQRLLKIEQQTNNKNVDSSIATLGTLKVKCDTISYIVSKKFEDPQCGDSRVKLIHYVDSDKTDSIYSTFDPILQQLPDYFMQINKNQIVNLKEVFKVQGDEVHLKKNKQSFTISDLKQAEFDHRLATILDTEKQ